MANQQATLTAIPLKASLNLNKIECDIKPYSGFHDDNALLIGGVKNNMYKKMFWNQTNGERTFICHKDSKNYFAVNKGINNIAVFEEDLSSEPNDVRLVTVIDSNKKFVKTSKGKYEESHDTTVTDGSSNEYSINWLFQSGILTLTVKKGENTASIHKLNTPCKNIRVTVINSGILFTVYDKYTAKNVSDVTNIIYRYSDGLFYNLSYEDNGTGFVWNAGDYFVFVGATGRYTDTDNENVYYTKAGIESFNLNDFESAITYVEDTDRVFKVDSSNLVLSTTLNQESTVFSEPIIRSNGTGIEVGIKGTINVKTEDERTDTAWTYFDKSGNHIDSDGESTFLSTTGDVNYGLWSGGYLEHINDNFDIAFYSGVPFCITSKNSRIKVEQNLDDILWDECTDAEVVYTLDDKKYAISISDQDAGVIDYQVIDDYIFFNVDAEMNTIRLSDGTAFNRSDDYIDFAIPYLKKASTRKYISNDVYAMFASGYHVFAYRDNYSDSGMILAPLTVKKAYTSESYSYYLPSGYENDIDIFWGKTSEDNTALSVPTYFTTLRNGYNAEYEDVYYPITSSNVFYNPTILDTVTDTYFDEYLFNDGTYSYVSARTQNQTIILGYYIQTLAEFNNMFIIAGTHFAVQGKYIIRLDFTNGVISGVSPIAYIGDMKFTGATLTEALFWSPIDRSFYTFKGDLSITKFIESNRISDIYQFFSQPSLSCIALATNDGILFFYGDQMIRLPLITKNRIYYTNSSFVIDNTEYCFLKRDGYTKVPVQIETEFYSSQPFVEETNDCVYITLFDEEPEKGTVELSCITLKEGQFKSENKIFNISPSMFDKDQKYLRLRYQPQYQTGAFSFKIKSDFPIANLAISHRANNTANSRYND